MSALAGDLVAAYALWVAWRDRRSARAWMAWHEGIRGLVSEVLGRPVDFGPSIRTTCPPPAKGWRVL